jgi:hypothetical protein
MALPTLGGSLAILPIELTPILKCTRLTVECLLSLGDTPYTLRTVPDRFWPRWLHHPLVPVVYIPTRP